MDILSECESFWCIETQETNILTWKQVEIRKIYKVYEFCFL